jgi:hypothetical protein
VCTPAQMIVQLSAFNSTPTTKEAIKAHWCQHHTIPSALPALQLLWVCQLDAAQPTPGSAAKALRLRPRYHRHRCYCCLGCVACQRECLQAGPVRHYLMPWKVLQGEQITGGQVMAISLAAQRLYTQSQQRNNCGRTLTQDNRSDKASVSCGTYTRARFFMCHSTHC